MNKNGLQTLFESNARPGHGNLWLGAVALLVALVCLPCQIFADRRPSIGANIASYIKKSEAQPSVSSQSLAVKEAVVEEPAAKFTVEPMSVSTVSTLASTEVVEASDGPQPIPTAEEESLPLSYSVWKDAKVVSAKNASARMNNRWVVAKKQGPLSAAVLEPKVAQAKQRIQVAQELSLDDYVIGYLSQFKDNPKAMTSLVKSLSPTEMADLLKVLAGGEVKEDRAKDVANSAPEKTSL